MDEKPKIPETVSFNTLMDVLRPRLEYLVQLGDAEFNYVRDLVNRLEENINFHKWNEQWKF